jgi:hypothetical protein
LSSPQGLALDAKGNLYVANNGANQILIYGPAYAQLTAKTISQNVSSPTAAAVDATGNILVANSAGGPVGVGSVTEYSSAGVQIPDHTITNGIDYPYAITTDGIGDIWVENNFNTVTVYAGFGSIPAAPIKTLSFANPVTGLAARNYWMAFGGNTNIQLHEIAIDLVNASTVSATIFYDAYSLAWDAAGNLYSGTIQNALKVRNVSTGFTSQLVALGYFPFGIAVDSVRARVYVSDANHNQINVYSTTTGALLHTIQ